MAMPVVLPGVFQKADASVPSPGLDVSVVIPCLDEAESIGLCVEKTLASFRAHRIRGEVVVTDNGSIDGSIGIAETHGARVVHAGTRGYGSAIRKGIEEA